jgi:hypothetical protein
MLTPHELYDIAKSIDTNKEFERVDILKKPILKQYNFFLKTDEIRPFPMVFSKPIMLEEYRPVRLCFIGKNNILVGYIVDNDDFVQIDEQAFFDIMSAISNFVEFNSKCKIHNCETVCKKD